MPSLALSDLKVKKEEKTLKKKIALETPESDKKMKKLKETKVREEEDDSAVKKSKKKRKASELQVEEEERSDTSSDFEEEVDGDEGKSEDPDAISRFRISEPLREKLKSKGIESLFPIQDMTFDVILDGTDLVGRARTGQGKTLAFVLPILESLTNGPLKTSKTTGYGRAPSVLVLLPTRELAKQVFEDFKVYGEALGLSSSCFYWDTWTHKGSH
ncbi:hypothetical protein V6N13_145504 [Hibiscus sabdariffa]|uniref:Helicase ATP-binding domain-containing protein n=1 Tax=Hibiscus sabdariffa TaxID=183260 RepID=A0ABR2TPS4_9ROSI